MALFTDIFLDAWHDTFALIPFLFVTYLVLELLEHAAGERVDAAVRRAGAAGPVVGAVLGIVPQCGFSAMGATLYAGRVVTLGTLVAVLLSTSDEMLPIFFAEQANPAELARILLVKVAVAAATGLALDALLRVLRGNARVHAALRRTVLGPAAAGHGNARGTTSRIEAAVAESADTPIDPDLIDELSSAGEDASHIHELCERAHCGCDEDGHGHDGDAHHTHDDDAHHAHDAGHSHSHSHARTHHSLAFSVLRSAVSHTVQVGVFIFVITFALVAVLDTVGEQALAAFLAANETLSVFASALVGLIPNCAASVVITQLYLEGVLSFGALMAGSLVSVGIGFLVLFRTNRSLRENLAILLLLYAVSVAWGLLFAFLIP